MKAGIYLGKETVEIRELQRRLHSIFLNGKGDGKRLFRFSIGTCRKTWFCSL